jgi:NADH-quinone oxidoreductase subunit M
MPWFAFFLIFSALASVGLPGLNGFVGEFLILTGAFKAHLILPTILATAGVVIAAIYLLKMLLRTLWGPLTKEENKGLADLSWREIITLVPLAILMLWMGVAPKAFLQPSSSALAATLERFKLETSQEPPTRPMMAISAFDSIMSAKTAHALDEESRLK